MTKKRTTQQKAGQRKVKAKRKAAKSKPKPANEDFSQAAARIVPETTKD